MNCDSFIAGAMAMNILWTIIHWWFPRKVEHLTESVTKGANLATLASESAPTA